VRAGLLGIVWLFVAFEARAADSLRLEDLEGTAVELAPAAGGALVIHFWATWCPSCKHELGALDRAARGCDAARVAVVAVDVGEKPSTVREYLAESPLALRLFYLIVVLAGATAITMYSVVKSKRMSDFLDALSDERLPAKAKFAALLDVWRKRTGD